MIPFDPATLPDWARKEPAVLSLCATDRAFLADVIAADTPAWQLALIVRARRLVEQQE